QDAGLQNPKVPTEVIHETGNDLVVGKILTEAEFTFSMTSWDVSCDMMAMLNGKVTKKTAGEGVEGEGIEGPSSEDEEFENYGWEDCQFINIVCPWASEPTGETGTKITSGVVCPMFYPSALTYKFGVTSN